MTPASAAISRQRPLVHPPRRAVAPTLARLRVKTRAVRRGCRVDARATEIVGNERVLSFFEPDHYARPTAGSRLIELIASGACVRRQRNRRETTQTTRR